MNTMSFGRKRRRSTRGARKVRRTSTTWMGKRRVYGFGKGKRKRWKVRSVKSGKFIKRTFATKAAAERYAKGKR